MELPRDEWITYGIARVLWGKKDERTKRIMAKIKERHPKVKRFERDIYYGWKKIVTGDCFDAWYEKKFFDYEMDDEDFRELQDELWMETGCAFDCSGRPFTHWIEAFKVRKADGTVGTWVYHRIGIDC